MSESAPKLIEVHLAAEWRAYPYWLTRSDDTTSIDFPPSELEQKYGVSSSLLAEIEEWDDEFQAIWDPADPASAEFPSPEIERQWVDHGRKLAHRLAAELGPDVRVTYRHKKEVIQPGATTRERNDD
ncbi:hypothetical protein LZ318_12340 [Saccharopolyspora indica]|uniref:hypothetical protein n=1 Tax=Saccharopolyspora indica TaxID=1229659 RepID=UPI0022EB1150|nr:hypothetical protein [Saccharopolyspora indica]MDA3643701.1 hypothetical protein [Saccharopolyspora indica]